MPKISRVGDAHRRRHQTNRGNQHRLVSTPTLPNVTDARTKRVFKIPRRDESRYTLGDGSAGSRLSLQEVFNRSHADVEGCSYNKDEPMNKVDVFGINRDIRCHLYDIKKIGRGELTFKDLMKKHPVFLNELRGIIERKWDILQKCKAQWGVDWAIQRVLQRDREFPRANTAQIRDSQQTKNRQNSVCGSRDRRPNARRLTARHQLAAQKSLRCREDENQRNESRPSQSNQQPGGGGEIANSYDTIGHERHEADEMNEMRVNSDSRDDSSALEVENPYDSERPENSGEDSQDGDSQDGDSQDGDSQNGDSEDERLTTDLRRTRLAGVLATPVRTARTRRVSTHRRFVSPTEEDEDNSYPKELEDRMERRHSKQTDGSIPNTARGKTLGKRSRKQFENKAKNNAPPQASRIPKANKKNAVQKKGTSKRQARNRG